MVPPERDGSTTRELRHRKHRRSFLDTRPPKRLFTPEIKRYLKSWLVRRRNHPYPNREEKKALAVQTGLTYMQICNWFANWRRKLKNMGGEVDDQTWTALIKSYNGHVEKNIEQFSLSSDDSIWDEFAREQEKGDDIGEKFFQEGESTPNGFLGLTPRKELIHKEEFTPKEKFVPEITQTPKDHKIDEPKIESQCFHISSTTHGFKRTKFSKSSSFLSKKKSNPLLLSRWLKSAAYFKPKKPPYLSCASNPLNSHFYNPFGYAPKFETIDSDSSSINCAPKFENPSQMYEDILSTIHGREELDAAEALTFLSRASRGFQ